MGDAECHYRRSGCEKRQEKYPANRLRKLPGVGPMAHPAANAAGSVRRDSRESSVGESPTGQLSFWPVATEAAGEATDQSEPSVERIV
jgi:hypothetical protein